MQTKKPDHGKKGRPQLRWEDYIKRDERKEDDKWKEKAADREKWEGITTGAGQQYTNGLHPFIKEQRGRTFHQGSQYFFKLRLTDPCVA